MFHLFNEIKQARISFAIGVATLKPVNIIIHDSIRQAILHPDADGCSRKGESRIGTESSEKEIPILPLILRRLADFPPQNSQIRSIRGSRNALQQRIAPLASQNLVLAIENFRLLFN